MKYAILNKDFDAVAPIDSFKSMIWTMRYRENGDFELITSGTTELDKNFELDDYVLSDVFYDQTANRAHLMLIESLEYGHGIEDGLYLKITGHSLKALLKRRIIWHQTTILAGTSVHEAVKKLVMENVINPADVDRKIDSFVWEDASCDWPVITEEIQYQGENLYDCVADICEKYSVGYEVIADFNLQKFVMHLLIPENRTYDNSKNLPPVIFSDKYENLKSSNYIESIASLKNVALVRGEGDELNRISVSVGESKGLSRRELFCDGSDLSQELEDGTIYGTTTYKNMLLQRGKTELNSKENTYIRTCEADVEPWCYSYPDDFNIGDIVEIVTEFKKELKAMVSEVVLSDDSNGYSVIPTFTIVDD